MKLIAVVLCLTAIGPVYGQEIGVVDLTRPDASRFTDQQKESPLPPDCTKWTGIAADGVRRPEDNKARPIRLQIIELNNEEIEVGSDVRAEVRLTNTGTQPIQIPWATDRSVTETEPDPDHVEWEEARFEVVLRDKHNNTILLKSAEAALYGTKFDNGTIITIKPGEWITALMHFRLEDEFRFRTSEIPMGRSELFLEWKQAFRRRDRAKCGWNTAFFEYRGYYKQEHPTVTVDVGKAKK
ncbi:MAG TPA: hypothetical protein VF133_11735 [Terriglobales bacterium]